MRRLCFAVFVLSTIVANSRVANADAVRITEFMSEGQGDLLSGNGGRRQREFFELTNLSKAPVNVSTWSYNDNNVNDPLNWGPTIGTIAPGESIVFTQMAAADFSAYWGLSPSVRVYSIGGLSNLGNGDTINIYNSFTQNGATLVDTLSYTIDARGSGVSRNRPIDGGAGATVNANWVISSVGDAYQSHLAPNATAFPPTFPNVADYTDLANPGYYPVPEPASVLLAGIAFVGLFLARRRQRVR
jgi:hypothetical protein